LCWDLPHSTSKKGSCNPTELKQHPLFFMNNNIIVSILRYTTHVLFVKWLSPGLFFLKVNTGGEDAFFVSNYNGGVIAVADGVSGYATFLVFDSCTVEDL